MKRHISVLFGSLILSGTPLISGMACRGVENLSSGSRAIGMGSAFIAMSEGAETIFFNPAGISGNSHPTLSFFITHLFGLQELSYETISAVLPFSFGHFGIAFKSFGQTKYRENGLTLGLAARFGRWLSIGILFQTVNIQIQKYGSYTCSGIKSGIIIDFTQQISFGLTVNNFPLRICSKELLPLSRKIMTGFCYMPIPDLTFCIELDKEHSYNVEIKGGCEIQICPLLKFRFGFGREPSYFCTGFGFSGKIFSLDYAITTHPDLGITHSASITLD